jgi:hypothetical protein
LTIALAILTSHCQFGFCIAHHVKIILLTVVVCQEKSALISPLMGILVWWSSDMHSGLTFLRQCGPNGMGESARERRNVWEFVGENDIQIRGRMTGVYGSVGEI